MTERDTDRLIAWSSELRRVHNHLRDALKTARASLETGDALPAISSNLFVYCRGFCLALGKHHRSEDQALFPAIEAAHPDLAPVLRNLEQDHSMIDYLIGELETTVQQSASPAEVAQHLEGVAAIMESHFAYEERQLLTVLDALALQASPSEVLGDF